MGGGGGGGGRAAPSFGRGWGFADGGARAGGAPAAGGAFWSVSGRVILEQRRERDTMSGGDDGIIRTERMTVKRERTDRIRP